MSVGNAGPDVSARFVFAVSLKPRSACTDWEQAQANLRRTIRSALHGAAGNAIVVVACHDVPELAEQDGGAVRICPVPFPEPVDVSEGGRDKARKRRHIGAWLREAMVDDELHVMFLDADDLVHKDLVPHVLDHGHGSYLVDRGYIVDVASGLVRHRLQQIGVAAHEHRPSLLDRGCGVADCKTCASTACGKRTVPRVFAGMRTSTCNAPASIFHPDTAVPYCVINSARAFVRPPPGSG